LVQEKFNQQGELVDADTMRRLGRYMQDLVKWVGRMNDR
jgi:hypothetical protein